MWILLIMIKEMGLGVWGKQNHEFVCAWAEQKAEANGSGWGWCSLSARSRKLMLREEIGGSDRTAAWSSVLRHDSSWVELRFLNCVWKRSWENSPNIPSTLYWGYFFTKQVLVIKGIQRFSIKCIKVTVQFYSDKYTKRSSSLIAR